jgi:hypothetical protein
MTDPEINDDLLSAYLDNALDPFLREAVSKRLADDAGARLRLERLRAADARLAAALPLPGKDHFHEAMAARILNRAADPPIARHRARRLTWAVAAALGGVIIGALLARFSLPALQLDSSVQAALRDLPGGTESSDGHVRVVLTIRSPIAGVCRVFEVEGARGGEGLACHGANGWQLKAWDATSVQREGFRPAGASVLIDAAMDALQGSAALDSKEETHLIDSDWAPRAP